MNLATDFLFIIGFILKTVGGFCFFSLPVVIFSRSTTHYWLLAQLCRLITDCLKETGPCFPWLSVNSRHSAQTGWAENELLFFCAFCTLVDVGSQDEFFFFFNGTKYIWDRTSRWMKNILCWIENGRKKKHLVPWAEGSKDGACGKTTTVTGI